VPNWLIWVLVAVVVLPGVVVVLAGVFAMFMMPANAEPRPPEADPTDELAPATEPEQS
jgi:hypothetical protein